MVRTNAVMGEQIAEKLDVAWAPKLHTVRNKVNLDGLNVLLEGATERSRRGGSIGWARRSRLPGRAQVGGVPAGRLEDRGGHPHRSVDEITRGVARAGQQGAQSVLINLADRLLPAAQLDRSSKTRLGRDIAAELDVPWTDTCYSTGETISLEGLNTILAGAERRLGRLGRPRRNLLASPESEGAALAAALLDGWKAEPGTGGRALEWLASSGARGANDNEWQGCYFEARGREVLSAAFPPSTTQPARGTATRSSTTR